MPQNPNLIATKCNDGEVHLFDYTKYPLKPSGPANPNLKLLGHSREGYGLAWAPIRRGHIISGGEDNIICHWDIEGATKESKTLQPLRTYSAHTAVVEDVAWHCINDSIFASVGDDRKLFMCVYMNLISQH